MRISTMLLLILALLQAHIYITHCRLAKSCLVRDYPVIIGYAKGILGAQFKNNYPETTSGPVFIEPRNETMQDIFKFQQGCGLSLVAFKIRYRGDCHVRVFAPKSRVAAAKEITNINGRCSEDTSCWDHPQPFALPSFDVNGRDIIVKVTDIGQCSLHFKPIKRQFVWVGITLVTRDIDECELSSVACKSGNMTMCRNSLGSYSCFRRAPTAINISKPTTGVPTTITPSRTTARKPIAETSQKSDVSYIPTISNIRKTETESALSPLTQVDIGKIPDTTQETWTGHSAHVRTSQVNSFSLVATSLISTGTTTSRPPGARNVNRPSGNALSTEGLLAIVLSTALWVVRCIIIICKRSLFLKRNGSLQDNDMDATLNQALTSHNEGLDRPRYSNIEGVSIQEERYTALFRPSEQHEVAAYNGTGNNHDDVDIVGTASWQHEGLYTTIEDRGRASQVMAAAPPVSSSPPATTASYSDRRTNDACSMPT